jgi:hypothetical protein
MTAALPGEDQEERPGQVRRITARAHDGGRSRLHAPSRVAKAILRDTVLSLLETGCSKQDIAAALDRLKDEAKGDAWQTVLDGRERTKQIMRDAARRATARRKAAEKLFQD